MSKTNRAEDDKPCPWCKKKTWEHFYKQSYYICTSCRLSVDYFVGDKYIEEIEKRDYYQPN